MQNDHEIKLLQTGGTKKGAGRLGARRHHAPTGPGEPPTAPRGIRGAVGAGVGTSCRANLTLLREEDLGLAATGSLRRDLWWWRHLEGAKG